MFRSCRLSEAFYPLIVVIVVERVASEVNSVNVRPTMQEQQDHDGFLDGYGSEDVCCIFIKLL